MIAIVNAIELEVDEIDEAIEVYNDFVIPARKSDPAYAGGHLLMDRKTGKGIAIVFWNRTLEEHEAYRGSGQDSDYKEAVQKFQTHMTQQHLPHKSSKTLGHFEVCTQG
ncbi:hypothetical protein ACFLVP_01250 [Chloroflexota bacterium]